MSVLVADIGGTNSRLAFVGDDGRPKAIFTIANDSQPDFESVLDAALGHFQERPHTAVLAIAGLIEGDEIALTNRAWRFRATDLGQRFAIERIRVVNDFEALAWALPSLLPADLRLVGPRPCQGSGVKVVLGPGTGLGVAALIPTVHGWQAIATESGHITFGASAEDEDDVFARLRREQAPISAETILSGPGLSRLYRAQHARPDRLSPERILAAARAGDHEALATTRLFVRLLGRFAGDMALTFKATGGVYVAGGVASGLGELFDDPTFRNAFERHPPYQNFLEKIPTALIVCQEPGLIGCAMVARSLRKKASRLKTVQDRSVP